MKRQEWSRDVLVQSTVTLLLLALGVAQALPAHAQPVTPAVPGAAEVVAVLQFEQVGASLLEASAATDRLQEELLASGRVVVVDRSRIEAVLKEQRLQQARCIEAECAANIGKILNARKLVIGKITRLDDTHWQISARVVDAETARIVRAPSVLYEDTFFNFLRWGMRDLADRIAEPARRGVDSEELGGGGRRPSQAAVRGSESGTSAAAPLPAEPKGRPAVSAAQPADPARAPRSGWAVFGGTVSRSGKLRRDQGSDIAYESNGGEVGARYQWAISPHSTANLVLAGIGGETSGEISTYYEKTGGGMIGGQMRHWSSGGGYLGIEVGYYTTTFEQPVANFKNDDVTMNGLGAGVVAGLQWPVGVFVDVTWSVETLATDDKASGSGFSGKATERMIRVSLGYQW